MDAHWGAEKVFDYWKNVRGRNSINGNGLDVVSYVHYSLNGYPYENAGWKKDDLVMVYGDGIYLPPLTTLDICAHEFGHGISQFTAGLIYEYEPGALDESLSDIWGAVIEYWAAPEKQRWTIGEDLGSAVRSMSNPNLYNQPDTYLGTYWYNLGTCYTPIGSVNDFCGVHTNSGVMNYWFYLLSEGGSGTNDNGSCFNVTGIGISNAAAIVYRAESYYLFSTAGYNDARAAMIQAASDIYGSSSIHASSVTNAWYAVGLGSASHTSGDISGTVVCSTGATITLNNSGPNVTWVASPANLFITNTGTGTSAYLQAATGKVSGPATITFTPVAGCGASNAISKSIWVGKPQNNFSGPTSVYPDQIYSYAASDPYTTNWVWSLSPGVGDCGTTYGGNCFFGSGGGGQNFTTVWMHESGYVKLTSNNACGVGGQKSVYVTVTTQGGCNPCQVMAIYPNPSSTELNIKLTRKNDREQEVEPTEIRLVDSYQTTFYSIVIQELEHTIPMASLPEGVYYIVVTNKAGTETKRVVVGR